MEASVLMPQALDHTGRMQRVRSALERHHANATATWQGAGHAFGVVFKRGQDEGYLPEAVTAVAHTVSMCVVNAPGIAEGSQGLCINNQPCRVTGPVVPDASGWATFPVVLTEGAHAGP